MADTNQPEPGRVRSLYLDFMHDGPYPRRGDRVSSGTTVYFVLRARRVKRRDPDAPVRVQMQVIRAQDSPDGILERLNRSAVRARGCTLFFTFNWHKREKKRKTFEQYLNPSKHPPG
jgi:hypothetical protein